MDVVNFRRQGDESLARQSFSGAYLYALMALVVGLWTPLGQEHTTAMFGLFGTLSLCGVLRWYFAKRLLLGAPGQVQWKLPLLSMMVLQALIWGIFAAMAVSHQGMAWTSLLVLLITAGMGSGGCIALTSSLIAMRLFLATLFIPSALVSVLNGHFALACAVTVYGIQLLLLGTKQSRWFWDALRANFELSEKSAELEVARREAVAGSQAKSAFLSVMSHEIRTPLNGVIGMTTLLADTELTEEQQEYASVIRGSGEALLSVINDVLDFSKIEAGHLDIEHLDFDLRASLGDVGDLLALKAHEKGLELVIVFGQDVPERVKGDPSRFRQVLLNLLSNAIKFTQSGGVTVRVSPEAATPSGPVVIRVDVSDTGVGIPQALQAALFEPFVHADTSTSRRFGGTGLGLAICKRLVEGQGGKIGLKSSAGQGSTFSFSIPFDPADEPVQPESPGPEIFETKILVVDDNATCREVLREHLRAWKCVVEETDQPESVVARLVRAADEKAAFDLLLIDFQMPGMGGLQLSAQIRDQKRVGATPIILMTEALQRSEAQRLRNCRIDGYLTKPVRRKALLAALAALRVGTPPPLVSSPSSREIPPSQRIRVLVADDNLVNQKMLSWMLNKEGYACDIAANGMEVLAAMERFGYDIILMDVQMPEMDGTEATRRIRQSTKRWCQVPVIAVTAGVSTVEREACVAAGMNDFLAKPIDRAQLVLMLKKHAPERSAGPQPAHPDLDEEQLQQVCSGDREFEKELVDTFLAELERTVAELQSALKAEDPLRIRRAAHSLKGASRYLGAIRLSKLSEQLEKCAAGGDLREAGGLLELLMKAGEVLRPSLLQFDVRSAT